MKSSCKLSSRGRYLGHILIVSALLCLPALQPSVAQSCTLQDLGAFPGSPNSYSYAIAINNRGQVVGYATTAGGGSDAFLYEHGVMIDLGYLDRDINPSGGSIAASLNDDGQVVGRSTATPRPLGITLSCIKTA